MREEMIKLNRIKYATSEEEKQKLIREGYVPVRADQDAAASADNPKTADPAADAAAPADNLKTVDPAADNPGTADPAAGAANPGDDDKEAKKRRSTVKK